MANWATSKQVKVAVDVQELAPGVILESLVQAGETYRTIRGRRAILIGTAALQELQRRYSLALEEGPDGTRLLKG